MVPFANKNTTARRTIDAVRQFFTNVGAPVKFWSGNYSNFGAREFKIFLVDCGVVDGLSSPHYAQSNGRVEAEIKTIKKIIASCSTSGAVDENKLTKAILLFRIAPMSVCASTAYHLQPPCQRFPASPPTVVRT